MKPVIQIFSKSAGLDHFFQIPVGSRQNTDIELSAFNAADPADRTIFKEPEHLDLGCQGKLGNFIQKQQPILRQFQITGLSLFMGAGKSAFFIPEQLRFNKRFGNGPAVDFDHGLSGPVRMLVNEICNQFFAGAGFAQNQGGGIHLADFDGLLEQFCHAGASGDDPAGFHFRQLHFQHVVSILILDGFLTLQLFVEGVDFRDIPLVDDNTDQLAGFIENGASRDHQFAAGVGILKHCHRISGFNHFKGGGSVDEALGYEIRHVAADHFGSPDIVQPLGGKIDPQHRGIGVADPQSVVRRVDNRIQFSGKFLKR